MKIACRVFVLNPLDCNPINLKQVQANTSLEKLTKLFPNSHTVNLLVGESIFGSSPLFPEPGISGSFLLEDSSPVYQLEFSVGLILERANVGKLTNKMRKKFSRRYTVNDFSTLEKIMSNIIKAQEELEAEGVHIPDELKPKTPPKGKTMKTIECKTLIIESPITSELTARIQSGDFTAKSLEGENVNLREVTLLIEPRMLAPFNSQDINTVCCLLKQLGDKLPAPQYCVGIIVKQTPRARLTEAMLTRSYKDVAVIDCEHLVNFGQYVRMATAAEDVPAIPSPISVDKPHTCACGGNCTAQETLDPEFEATFKALLHSRTLQQDPNAAAMFFGVQGNMKNQQQSEHIKEVLNTVETALLAHEGATSPVKLTEVEKPLYALLTQTKFDDMNLIFGFGCNMQHEADRNACLSAISQLRGRLD
jgi:hypothetical protein